MTHKRRWRPLCGHPKVGRHASVHTFREAEVTQLSEAKARRTLPSARAWLWIAPDPVIEQQTERALSFLRLRTSRPTAPPRPWLLLSVYVRWGGNPSSVINICNLDSSSHPTHHRATRRGETRSLTPNDSVHARTTPYTPSLTRRCALTSRATSAQLSPAARQAPAKGAPATLCS